eukprot:scaffold161_cov380-Prasinococcus_capsulatus_cf.AAC.1
MPGVPSRLYKTTCCFCDYHIYVCTGTRHEAVVWLLSRGGIAWRPAEVGGISLIPPDTCLSGAAVRSAAPARVFATVQRW